MKTCKLTSLAGLAGLLISLSTLAGVYMEKDAQGNTIFTDRPSSEQAKPVEISPNNTYETPAPASSTSGSRSETQDTDTQRYESLTIISPTDDSPLRSNDGALEVSVDLSPGLNPNHHFVLLMDGNPVAEGQSPAFSLQNVDRGTHAIQVQVVDDAGNALISSDSITFHMLRV